MISIYGGVMMVHMGTSLSIEDCYDLIEVATVDSYNRKLTAPKKGS